MEKLQTPYGKVILAGAGPGDPELITVKAWRHLQKAEVVIADRLVSPVILEEFVPKDAQVIHVGKQRGKESSTPQSLINELLVDYARQGKRVVRLKGGDVSIFSNILDELQSLVDAGIPFEIVPGITAAMGAAAYAGIPLTARGHASAVRFQTLHQLEAIPSSAWKELAATEDTLAFYMSTTYLGQLVEKLLEFHADPEKPLAIIEQATTPSQSVQTCRLKEFHSKFRGKSFASPTLVLIGSVVDLHASFQWFQELSSKTNYFEALADHKQLSARA